MYQEKHDCGEADDIPEEMNDPPDDRNMDELRVHLCIELELRHDCGDADVCLEESEDIEVIDDPREEICISE